MRILHLCWSGSPGGLENFAWDLASEQARQHDVAIGYLTLRGDRVVPPDSKGLVIWDGGMKTGRDVIRFLGLMRRVRQFKPQVIHNHEANPLAFFARGACLGAVLVNHVHTIAERTQGAGVGRLASLARRAVDPLVRMHIANSNSTRLLLMDQRGIPSERIRVVPNGIHCERFASSKNESLRVRGELAIPNSARVVGTVGHLTHRKGPDLFLQAARHVLDAVPGCFFVLVGGGELQAAMERLAGDLGIPPARIRFLGDRQDVPRLLGAFDVLVSSSRVETFGIAVLEAMAAGVPVVAFETDGIPEVTADTAWLVRRLDVKELGRVVADVVTGREPSAERITRARSRARDRFDIRAVAATVGRLYSDLLSPL
jgi:glycosyltransferase involved in cell wall biosynthesis